ncbi:MAG: response regulator [Alphaproteobacteria bacterium]|nr:response regulator [Alphaproteobacteria bacterium]
MATCLIADDSKVIRLLLSKIMSNLGFSVIEAEDGEDVIELTQTQEPDVIIMDWSLPVLDGIDALYKLRASNLPKAPKIIFCSSSSDLDRINQAIKGGADDYIIKPFDEDIVASKLTILGLL